MTDLHSPDHCRPDRYRRVRRGAVVVTAGLAATVLAACSSSSGSGSSPTSASSTAESTAGIEAAAKALASYTGIPAFGLASAQPAVEKLDVSALKGKLIFAIPQSASNPFVAQTQIAEKAIAAKYGIEYVQYNNQGTPAEWQRGINQAISQKASAILLDALDPKQVLPQIAAAKAAGIPVISTQFYDVTDIKNAPTDVTAVRGDNFKVAGSLEADQAIVDTKGNANAVVVLNTEQESSVAMQDAIKAEFASKCPKCKATFINIPSSEWATKIQTSVASALVADPKVNWIIPIYDPMTQFVIPAITAAGKTSSIGISTFNGIPAVLTLLAQKGPVKMDVGENLEWLASANMDQAFRTMLGKKPLDDQKTALRVFTPDNVGETGNPPAFNTGFGTAYSDGYKTLWGSN